MILSQGRNSDGSLTPWCNVPVGNSENLMHAKGDQVTLLAEILELTPPEVNDTLKGAGAFDGDQIIWEKLFVAFPEWAAQVVAPYNNDVVLEALAHGKSVIVVTDKQAVRYMGGGLCHDPKTGTERPTRDFPAVLSVILLTRLPKAEGVEPAVPTTTLPEEVKNEENTTMGNTQEQTEDHKQKGKSEEEELREKIEGLTQKQKNAVKKYLKQMHVANLAIKKLLDL